MTDKHDTFSLANAGLTENLPSPQNPNDQRNTDCFS